MKAKVMCATSTGGALKSLLSTSLACFPQEPAKEEGPQGPITASFHCSITSACGKLQWSVCTRWQRSKLEDLCSPHAPPLPPSTPDSALHEMSAHLPLPLRSRHTEEFRLFRLNLYQGVSQNQIIN